VGVQELNKSAIESHLPIIAERRGGVTGAKGDYRDCWRPATFLAEIRYRSAKARRKGDGMGDGNDKQPDQPAAVDE
jgi:hypothetical protein